MLSGNWIGTSVNSEYIVPAGPTDSAYLLGCNLIDGVVSVDDD